MEPITKKDILEMTAMIVAGILSNPASAVFIDDQYRQQQIIIQTFQNITDAFSSISVPLATDK